VSFPPLRQVEALGDLLASETEAQRSQALKQMRGDFAARYDSWRERLVRVLAHVEAVIDFAEDEADVVESSVLSEVVPLLARVHWEVQNVLGDTKRGQIIRDGFGVAIVGVPNAGKSSLLNALSDRCLIIIAIAASMCRISRPNAHRLAELPANRRSCRIYLARQETSSR